MKNLVLNQPFMLENNVNAIEYALFDFLKNSEIKILNLNQILKELPAFFKTKDNVYRIYKKLIAKNIISTIHNSDEVIFKLLNNNHKNNRCLFCDSGQNIHKHHFPIRKKDKGTATILLCSECHLLFHSMADYHHCYKVEK